MAAPNAQVCDCCGCESERLFQSPDFDLPHAALWLCYDCLIGLLRYRKARRAARVAAVTITDDEAGTEWTIYE